MPSESADKQRESKNIRIFSLYSCSLFSFEDMSTLLTRYEINPSFAQQTYRVSGISSCVSNVSKIPLGIYLDARYPLGDNTPNRLRGTISYKAAKGSNVDTGDLMAVIG